jgi:hypothetical protein
LSIDAGFQDLLLAGWPAGWLAVVAVAVAVGFFKIFDKCVPST